MKKFLLIVLALVVVFSFVSCGCEEETCTNHVDANADNKCDTCDADMPKAPCTEHVDADNNGKCDKCEADMPKAPCTEHVDADKNGKCDNCDATVEIPKDPCTEHVDADKNGKCDNCDATVEIPKDPCTEHVDADKNGKCDKCEADMPKAPCTEHVDADKDGKCDECGETYVPPIAPNSIEAFARYYANSTPTKVVINAQRGIKDESGNEAYNLNSKYVLVTGTCAGKLATVYSAEYEELRSVEEGSNEEVMDEIKTVTYVKEFLDGKIRETKDGVKGAWTKGLNFAPSTGSILAINLDDPTLFSSVEFNVENPYNQVMTLRVLKKNVENVFGTDEYGDPNIDADSAVNITITSNGATITSIALSYTVPKVEDDDVTYPAQSMVMTATYSYDLQTITIE